ncbi:MAG: hypothetical protein JO170_13205 [Verrucomicrobia bacterium]|nr:hypothetical protein [Verrucomicrobiota bacterium]
MANTMRLRLSDLSEIRDLSGINGSAAFADASGVAWEIAQSTVTQLVGAGLLDQDKAMADLKSWRERITRPIAAPECVLTYLLPDEESLRVAARILNESAVLQTWEFAHRIPPPEAFYRGNPEIDEGCKRCGVVVLDASTPATITTGSINPAGAEFFLPWLEAKLGHETAETRRRRFSFHVVIPTRHWTSILRAHFPSNYGI